VAEFRFNDPSAGYGIASILLAREFLRAPGISRHNQIETSSPSRPAATKTYLRSIKVGLSVLQARFQSRA
jgi:hypothetical protein